MNNVSEILVVDDVPEQIAFAGALLREEGYRVYAVTSGIAALKFLENRRPDLIMLDIKMEHIDGFEVCRRIKLNSMTKDIPIIFITSHTNPEVIKRCFELGACDYVAKPYIREEYLERVRAHISASRQSRALTAANKELNLFCSAVSHDLKSPLNVINMLIEMLRAEIDPEEGSEALSIMDMISDKSKKLTVMIERLLEFSKMCNINPEKKQIDIEAIIHETFEELIMLENDRKIELVCPELPEVMADDVLVKMLIKNLISNAIKFTRHKETAVITAGYASEGIYDVITISDNGAGFDMEYADKLFQIFQRLHSDEEFEGTGVGLALADRIMKRHGGYVKAAGEVDKGASFSLYFLKA